MTLGLFLGLQWLRCRHACRVSEDAPDLDFQWSVVAVHP